MAYYEDQKRMKQELAKLIEESKNGTKIKIVDLTYHYSLRFGFGKRTVENALKIFKEQGSIIMTASGDFEVVK